MLPVYTSSEMRECDRTAIQEYNIPGIVLMENASRGALDIIEKIFGSVRDRSVFIFCGKGNNGGDGFAIARHTINRGAHVHCFLLAPDEQISGDAKTNLTILRKISESTARLTISIIESKSDIETFLSTKPDIIVDALFGTGLTSGITGLSAEIIETINRTNIPVAAIDIPSGVNGDTGDVNTVAIKARCTATMGALKRGLLFGRGKEHAGSVHIIDIGIPESIFSSSRAKTFLVEKRDVSRVMPFRAFDVHKYQVGKVFILAGSIGYTGAAAMASESALRTGAGIVHLGIPKSLNAILEEKVTEVITIPLDETSGHSFSIKSFETVMQHINSAHVSIIGPGIGRNEETLELIRKIIAAVERPLVVDADGLFALIDHPELLKNTIAPIVLTPHIGEFGRLIGRASKEIEGTRVEIARNFAIEHHLTLVLKGAPTITATSTSEIYINATGNPGMATAGMGDVLCGVIGGLYAQGTTIEEAAWTGVYIHGAAGDEAKREVGEEGLLATDVLHALPQTMMHIKAPR